MNKDFNGIVMSILAERNRQERLKSEGKFRYTCADVEISWHEKMTVLMEEVGEVARAVLNKEGLATDENFGDLESELVQVAAVCVAWLESLS